MFLKEPPESPARDAAYAADLNQNGFVWALTKLWAWNPELDAAFSHLVGLATESGGLSFRDRGILVSTTAAAIENSSCALAWGNRLARASDVDTAIRVLRGDESPDMTERDRVLARWARKVSSGATSTTQADVDELRGLGMDDRQIHAITLDIAMRIAFSTVNDALDAPLDRAEADKYPEDLVAAVDFGRPSA